MRWARQQPPTSCRFTHSCRLTSASSAARSSSSARRRMSRSRASFCAARCTLGACNSARDAAAAVQPRDACRTSLSLAAALSLSTGAPAAGPGASPPCRLRTASESLSARYSSSPGPSSASSSSSNLPRRAARHSCEAHTTPLQDTPHGAAPRAAIRGVGLTRPRCSLSLSPPRSCGRRISFTAAQQTGGPRRALWGSGTHSSSLYVSVPPTAAAACPFASACSAAVRLATAIASCAPAVSAQAPPHTQRLQWGGYRLWPRM